MGALKKLAARSNCHVSPRQNRRQAGDLDYLGELYTSRRRRLEPEYNPPPGLRRDLAKLLAGLTRVRLGRKHWPLYLDFCFKAFPRFAPLAFPPARAVAGEALLDSYLASLGRRKLDLRRAAAMLAAAGYGDLPAWVVADMARSEAASPGALAGIEDRRFAEAAAWLRERLDEVGYADE